MDPQTPLAPVPFLAAEHAWHCPVQPEAQQTPSTQKPDWHWSAALQAAPCARSGWQVPSEARQWELATQSSAPAQLALQAFGPQVYGAHGVVVSVQVPLPSQVEVLAAPDVQVAAPQLAPAAYSAQAPAPLHAPLVPQLAAP